MTTIEIREAELRDLQDLAKLFEVLMEVPSNIEAMGRQLAKVTEDPRYFLAVACDGDKVIGTAMGIECYDLVGSCHPFLVVENVVVNPDYRGQGVGKMLMKRLEQFAEERVCSYIIFVSSGYREKAHQFYRALGYSSDNQGFKKQLRELG
ncbi:GNAT family N-acetyltransferase [Paenibacillus sp. JDR-2]|uniref:GNAT family N-acetyltransferase n=1 Tax=Paenibacillus sp. (strain JDR-2) TaxID=324057 RepID=UPI000166B217|nr:GNAT family N-acetyltransferase [Paenibacillus sp. JDR-2]ACS99381.1 GCN5-related N-acetyltransferase [Paenibacillus sp. JDR-2]